MEEEAIDTNTIRLVGNLLTYLAESETNAALIGAMAMAIHGYIRGTSDWDIAVVNTQPANLFSRIETWLPAGCTMAVALPDVDDPLGGGGADHRQ